MAPRNNHVFHAQASNAKAQTQSHAHALPNTELHLGMGVASEPEKRAPFIAGMGTKFWEKMGMGRVWGLRLKMGMGMGMDS